MKIRSFSLTLVIVILALSCIPKEEVKPEITIPPESQAVFTSGMSFDSGEQSQIQTKTILFTATDYWSITITETTKSLSWLSIQPFWGGAGTVNMTVSVLPNTDTSPRGATVTITCGTDSESFTVTQAGITPAVIPVSSVTLNKTELTLEAGGSENLIATVAPDNATDKAVTWSSSDVSVATVDQNGKVKAVDAGTATITAKAGEKEATCEVTVTIPVVPVESITLDKTTVTLEEGETIALTAMVKPDNATDNTIIWSSSNTSVVTVSDGVVTAVAEGNATITASIGDVTATCSVTVIRYVFGITPAEITISGDGDTFTVTVVCTVQYSVTSMPSWISQQSVADKVHTFKAERNPGDKARTGVITFTDAKGTSDNCTVNQGIPTPDEMPSGENEGTEDEDWN